MILEKKKQAHEKVGCEHMAMALHLSQELHKQQAMALFLLRSSERKGKRHNPSENAIPSSPREVELGMLGHP